MPGFLAGLVYSRRERVVAAVLANTTARFDPESLASDLVLAAVAGMPRTPTAWRPGDAPPADAEPLLGRWWSEGSEYVFRWRDGHLEARSVDDKHWEQPSVFVREEADRYRVVSGTERGELLLVERAADGSVTGMSWATYPFRRQAVPFGT
jgi:hypothetical protein